MSDDMKERPAVPDGWIEFEYSDPDPDAVAEELQKQQRHKLHKPVESGVDEERGPYDVIPLAMVLGGEAKPTTVFKTPMKHMVLDQGIPPRGWYKNAIEGDRVRPRPCLLPDAKVNTPWGDKEIQHLQPGDIVFGYDEVTCQVTQTYVQGVAKQTKCEYLELELENGRTLRLTPEHLVLTKLRGWVEADTLTTEDDVIGLGARYQRTMQRLCGVYGILNKYDGKLYVGSAVDVVDRLNRHMRELIACKHSNMHLQAAYNRGDQFDLLLLEECDRSVLVEREQYYMDLYDSMNNVNGYNMTIAGRTIPSEDGVRRIKASRTGKTWEEIFGPEVAAKMRAKMHEQTGDKNPNWGNRGELNPMTGKTYEEMYGEEEAARLKAITRDALTGRPKSAEHRQKVSAARMGTKLTKEHKQAIADSLARMNFKPPAMTEEQKLKISITLKRRYAAGELDHVKAAVSAARKKAEVLHEG